MLLSALLCVQTVDKIFYRKATVDERFFLSTVALNFQTAGLMMDLYHGWFQKNGGCGYILKPAIMREEIAYFSANTRDVIPGVSPQILHIKVGLYSETAFFITRKGLSVIRLISVTKGMAVKIDQKEATTVCPHAALHVSFSS